MIGALRHRSFRLIWLGMVFITTGFWLQVFATGWLVVEIAAREGHPERASLYIGIVSLGQAVGIFGSTPYSGVLVDRMDRRTVLLWSNTLAGVSSLALAALTLTGHINVIWLALLSTCASVAIGFDGPARQAMTPRIVASQHVVAAIGLMTVLWQGSAIVGPLLGGVLIVPLGVGGIYAVKTLSHAIFQVSILQLPPQRPLGVEGVARQSAIASLIEGVRFIWMDPILRIVVILNTLIQLIQRPVLNLLPAFAANVLGLGPVELSWLLTGAGVGSFIAALLVAWLGALHRRGAVILGATAATGLLTVAFVAQRGFVAALLVIAAISAALLIGSNLVQIVLQTRPPDRFRGRVTSLNFLAYSGAAPLGAAVVGAFGALVGVETALAWAGVVSTAMALAFAVGSPMLRRLTTAETRRPDVVEAAQPAG